MATLKILSIVGARPQFIKATVVSRALRSTDGIEEILVHTGQHYDINLSDVFFEELGIPEVGYNLGVGSGSHGYQTGKMLEKIEDLLLDAKPDLVLVYGDTNSTLAGALASVKLHIPVAHVEAGLRSFNRKMPEEINRVLTDHSSDILFAPTKTAVQNLQNEGIEEKRIHLVGDVMYDAALFYGAQAEMKSRIMEKHNLFSGQYVLATIHRAENTDDKMKLSAIIESLSMLAEKVPVVFPIHPRTKNILDRESMMDRLSGNVKVLEPVGYLDMIMLEKNATVIATDSGGVQKEAYFYKVPCVTLREETEWVELVNSGWNQLCPPISSKDIFSTIISSTNKEGENVEFYGNGKASEKIACLIGKLG